MLKNLIHSGDWRPQFIMSVVVHSTNRADEE